MDEEEEKRVEDKSEVSSSNIVDASTAHLVRNHERTQVESGCWKG